ncbi:hypothetical protein [Lysobacter gummosus]|uniref:hypothetical protein n=1 Tax=Lysobacter gummosus TaxID=262324 RepID=UPI00363552E8
MVTTATNWHPLRATGIYGVFFVRWVAHFMSAGCGFWYMNGIAIVARPLSRVVGRHLAAGGGRPARPRSALAGFV